MNKPWRALLVLTVLAAVSLVLSRTVFGGNAYVAHNEALLRSLPVYPGAVRVSLTSSPYYADDAFVASSPLGYGTLGEFRVPKGTVGRVVARFYVGQLTRRGWRVASQRRVRDRGAGTNYVIYLTGFMRSGEYVSVDTSNVGYAPRTYEVYVDYQRRSR